MKTKTMCSGFSIEAYEASSREPAYVCLHELGETTSTYFTPTEATKFGASIMQAAGMAEPSEPSIKATQDLFAVLHKIAKLDPQVFRIEELPTVLRNVIGWIKALELPPEKP